MRFVKDPDAILDYQINWEDWLDGDTISASSWEVDEGLTGTNQSYSDSVTTIWLSGGTVDIRYTLTNTIETNAGRTEERSFFVDIKER